MTNERMLKLVNDYINTQDLTAINELKQGIEENIRTAANKKVNMNLARSMNNVLKLAKKAPNKTLHYAFKTDGWLTVCDGYRFIRTKQLIELETTNEKPEFIKNIIDTMNAYDRVIVPTIQELNAHIKIEKAKLKRGESVLIDLHYTQYEDTVTVNAEYLKDILIASEYEFINHEHGKNGPIEFISPQVHSILLPIRTKK